MKLTKPQAKAIEDIQAGLPAGCTLTIGAATALTVVEDTTEEEEAEEEDPPEEEEEVKETAAEKKKRLAAEKKAAAAKKKSAAAKANEEDDAVTLKDLRAMARPIVKDGRGSEVAEILEEFGAESLTKLDEEHYPEMKERLEELAI